MRRLASILGLGALVVGGAAGCPSREVARIDPDQATQERKRIPVSTIRDIDILFVIDNSGSMGEEQSSLAQNFGNFMSVLNNIEGGLPNVHIGVVSSNTGVGGYNITGCGGGGDAGKLQNTARGACSPPTGAFIEDVLAADGVSRVKNYSGTLEETFSCIAQLGTSGCGFEQHLESMKLALDGSQPFNGQFLRPNAYLAVIFIADEDDCSASNPMVFDPNDTALTGTLGPLTSYRCTEFGIQCDQGLLGRSPASYTGCKPRENSPYMQHPEHYVQFLKGLKQDPNLLIVAGIIGNPDPVSVSTDGMNRPELDPSCSSGAGEAVPGIRLKYLIDSFPNRNTFTSICNNDLSEALTLIAELLARVIGNPCLEGNIDTTDLDPNAPGLQVDCAVQDVQYPDTAQESSTTIARCPMSGDTSPDPNGPRPCWWVEVDAASCNQNNTPTDLVLHVERSGDPAPGTYVYADCVVDNG